MKQFLIMVILLFLPSLSYAQEIDLNTSLIQKRKSRSAGIYFHYKMITLLVRQTTLIFIVSLTPFITQTLLILATTMPMSFFTQEVVSIFMAKKRVFGRYFFNGLETENKLSQQTLRVLTSSLFYPFLLSSEHLYLGIFIVLSQKCLCSFIQPK